MGFQQKTIGPYQVAEQLGEGGMGFVYRGVDPRLERTVALKILSSELHADADSIARFRREAKVIAALDHPNICRVHEVLESADGRPVIVMPLYEGRTLKQRLRDGALGPEAACEVASQIAAGLAVAHKKGIVHRDIKPANIMLSETGEVKILDFGIAKLHRDPGITRTGAVIGSPAYMSPEQASGRHVAEPSDVWSLGVVFYELLTGRPPFDGAYEAALLYAIVNEDPPSLHESGADLAGSYQELVNWALAKDPAQRPDMETFRQALDDIRFSRPLSPTHSTGTPLETPTQELVASASTRRYWLGGVAGFGAFALGAWSLSRWSAPAVREAPRIAVLPFENFGDDPDADYFGEGLAQDLLTNLSKVRALRLISRTSTGRYRATSKPIPEIAEELGATHVIEGSVRKFGSRVRVTVQLIDASTDEHLWADSYDSDLNDLLSLQARLTSEISTALRVEIGAEQRRALETPPTRNPQAYDLYLRALYQRERRSPAALRQGVQLLSQAVEADPEFAAAFGELGTQYVLLGAVGAATPKEVTSAAGRAAERALALAPDAGYGYRIRGALLSVYEWQWERAESVYLSAIERGDLMARTGYAMGLLLFNLRFDEAEAQLRAVEETDPLSGILKTNLALVESGRRNHEKALALASEARRLEPALYATETRYAQTLARAGRYREAIEHLETLPFLQGDAVHLGWLGMCLGFEGRSAQARKALETLSKVRALAGPKLLAVAMIHLGLGETENCLQELERCLETRYPTLGYINPAPEFDPVRTEPRFQSVLQRMNLA